MSETMNFDLFLFSEFDTTEEFCNALALVPLQLDDLPVLGMVNDGTVASKFLCDSTKDYR